MEQEIQAVTREELLKVHRRRKLSIITNIVLIIVLLLIGGYVYFNVEHIKNLEGGACKFCEEEMGMVCQKITDFKIILKE